ncbi:MAG: T9SS type A sorting domain-containing protein [Flavobacteriales bacterium]|nr:T9SS type A sorting domain-containing protein [Flavobacteriales bacterium]
MRRKIILLSFLLAGSIWCGAQNSENFAVSTTAEALQNGHVKLSFLADQYGNTYNIHRMGKGERDWGNPLHTFTGISNPGWMEWTDTTAMPYEVYEYRVFKSGVGNFTAAGYIMTGYGIPAVHDRGKLLMLVEASLMDSLAEEINLHAMDIAADGWWVDVETIDETENTVPQVRALIDDKLKDGDLEGIYLFGHIAVPYSGQYCNHSYYTVPPDGHGPGQGDHCGAWAADVYYAVHDATWYDDKMIVDAAARTANQNRKDDGKFDEIWLPGKAESQLGRVDLSDMPIFPINEIGLMRRYMNKNHAYRYNLTKTYALGLVDENFPASAGAFASTAWRNFPSLIGKGKTESKDFLTTLKDSTYLLAYGTGAGSYTSCNKVATSQQMTTENSAIFNFLFGSYFGDWDIRNNFLRAALGTEKGGLTNAWSGRPWWHIHPMGLGETIGYCTRLTQNNERRNGPETYTASTFENNIHIALMGDPTLRMYMFDPPKNLTLTTNGSRNEVAISWTPSAADGVIGYHLYYSWSPTGPYVKVNHDLITANQYNHTAPFDGDVYYMVRAERLETTPSGSFYNLSQGIINKIESLDAAGIREVYRNVGLKLYPNPSDGHMRIELDKPFSADVTMQLFDLQGRLLYETALSGPVGKSTYQIDLSAQPDGIYLLSIGNTHTRISLIH